MRKLGARLCWHRGKKKAPHVTRCLKTSYRFVVEANPCVPELVRKLCAMWLANRKFKRNTEFAHARHRVACSDRYSIFAEKSIQGKAERRNASSATVSKPRKRSRKSAGSTSRKMRAVRCIRRERRSSKAMYPRHAVPSRNERKYAIHG